MTQDRRRPVARYVLFTDPTTQTRFAGVAEAAYQDLARLDQWNGVVMVDLPSRNTVVVVRRKGLLRRTVEEERAQTVTVGVTAALAEAMEAVTTVPRRLVGLGACEPQRALADAMAAVVLDLVRDLAEVEVGQQALHPAYRQTLRLAAELRALHDMVAQVGCENPVCCVRARPPEHWGRRVEDVEVAEVRAVLAQLAATGYDGSPA